MRLFVGIDVGAQVAASAGEVVAALQRRARRLAPAAKVTWIPSERLHLTVRFIGHVDDPQHRAIADVLQPPLPVRAFDVVFGGTGAFPKSGPPRVIWAGVTDGLDRLAALEREVTGRLQTVGVDPDDREYRPHLTLARIRDAAGLRAAVLLEGQREANLGARRVEAITLFESRLSPKGPTYVVLQQTPLAR